MEFNCKQFKCKAFQFLNIVEMLHPNTRWENCPKTSPVLALCLTKSTYNTICSRIPRIRSSPNTSR